MQIFVDIYPFMGSFLLLFFVELLPGVLARPSLLHDLLSFYGASLISGQKRARALMLAGHCTLESQEAKHITFLLCAAATVTTLTPAF